MDIVHRQIADFYTFYEQHISHWETQFHPEKNAFVIRYILESYDDVDEDLDYDYPHFERIVIEIDHQLHLIAKRIVLQIHPRSLYLEKRYKNDTQKRYIRKYTQASPTCIKMKASSLHFLDA